MLQQYTSSKGDMRRPCQSTANLCHGSMPSTTRTPDAVQQQLLSCKSLAQGKYASALSLHLYEP
jgi:hypothetical protein